MQKLALLVHGFNVADEGKGSTDKLRPYFEAAGYTVCELDYSWTGLVGVSLCDKKIAKVIAELAPRDADTVAVGHSNGCAILADASREGAEFDQMVFINPAINRDEQIGPQVKRIHVWHSPGDMAVKIGRFALPWAWGDMGAVGYRGKDQRFVNYDKSKIPPFSKSHSDMFEDAKIKVFGPLIVEKIEQSIQ